MNHKPNDRPPRDAFDEWLLLVDRVVIRPVLEIVQLLWRTAKGWHGRNRSHRHTSVRNRGHRRKHGGRM